MPASPIRLEGDGIRLALRVTPNATRETIEAVEERPGAGSQLRIRVRAVPEKGKANAAVIALLARAFNLPASLFSIVAGESGRDKVVHIQGKPDALAAQLSSWFEARRS